MESFIREGPTYEETRPTRVLLGKRVLSKSGDVIGRVVQLRIDTNKRTLEGVVVRKGFIRTMYVCMSYVTRITEQALMLGIDPAALFLGRSAVSADGKKFGTVIALERVNETNEVVSVTVRRYFVQKITIPKEEFSRFGTSLILKSTHDQARKKFTP